MSTRMSAVRRIERKLSELGVQYSNLDVAFDADELASTKVALERLKADAESGGEQFRLLLPDSANPIPRLTNFIAWLGNYRSFKVDAGNSNSSDAARIRQHVLMNYINPARERDEKSVSVPVIDVHNALGLSQAWANVCQALNGRRFQSLADVPPPLRAGPEFSSTTIFTFDLTAEKFTIAAVEVELTRRFGEPIKQAQYIAAWQLPAGRQIAVDRSRPPAQLWIEADLSPPPAVFVAQMYAPAEGRHSGLPPRLNHAPSGGLSPRAVAMIRAGTMAQLVELLDWYATPDQDFNREQLERYRQAFLDRYGDFEPEGFFAGLSGYYDEERAYKDELIRRTQEALRTAADQDDAVLGGKLLDILTGQSGVPSSDLLGWRTDSHIKGIRAKHRSVLERAAGKLARADDVTTAIIDFIDSTWTIIAEDQSSKPYSVSRNLPSMLAALVHPETAYGINTDPLSRFATALTGEKTFGRRPMTRGEYERVVLLAESVRKIMAEEWGWSPRDLWDVQGFVWAVNRSDGAQQTGEDEETREMQPFTSPTNLILYGPPGTGKTYATAREAVLLCSESAPQDRAELMTQYASLVASGRIEFVTFHQSYSYEDFVEGLRPIQAEGASNGFSLEPRMGAFRRIARRAETSTGHGSAGFQVGDRRIFKMSIGEAANPDDAHLFDDSVTGGYTLLGFEDIDWSDSRYEKREAIIEACKKHSADASDEPNAQSGKVQCPFLFRNAMQNGDIVIVSKGNSLFRAIGVVLGAYEYVPRQADHYSHRRAVNWLWQDRAGVPVGEIYSRNFSQRSIYELDKAELNMAALERYIVSQQSADFSSVPEQFVLIIDEINRANISKVFGELITLIEPDKRIGAPNELRIQLPYSQDTIGVPANLHIIGTMNTADRSIALLDTALRRRFEFRELMPDPTKLSNASAATGINLVKMLTVINERIEYLFDRDHQIGHAYFIGCTSRPDVDATMRHKIIPLLAEYFYEDWSRVAAILGDGNGEGRFLDRILLLPPLGLTTDEDSEPRYRWLIKSIFDSSCYDPYL